MEKSQRSDDLYHILGVPKKATHQQIKGNFRTLSKQYHPDRGGDIDNFIKIQTAYRVLSNKKKREQYDRTGQWSEELLTTDAEQVTQLLAKLYEHIITTKHVTNNTDLKKLMLGDLKQNKDKITEGLDKLKQKRKYLKSLIGKMPKKDGEESIFDKTTQSVLSRLEHFTESGEQELKTVKMAIQELENYNSVFEAATSFTYMMNSRGSIDSTN